MSILIASTAATLSGDSARMLTRSTTSAGSRRKPRIAEASSLPSARKAWLLTPSSLAGYDQVTSRTSSGSFPMADPLSLTTVPSTRPRKSERCAPPRASPSASFPHIALGTILRSFASPNSSERTDPSASRPRPPTSSTTWSLASTVSDTRGRTSTTRRALALETARQRGPDCFGNPGQAPHGGGRRDPRLWAAEAARAWA